MGILAWEKLVVFFSFFLLGTGFGTNRDKLGQKLGQNSECDLE
jgi:hypothetical protein